MPRLSLPRRALTLATAIAVAVGIAVGAQAHAAAPTSSCVPRVLVLSAMPSELGPLLDAATVEQVVRLGDRTFYVGRLEGNDVILAMTDIGLVNAHETANAAFSHFRCGATPGISAVVFSGVSGGKTNIGDVTVVDRWTKFPHGPVDMPVDPTMMTVAKQAAIGIQLERTTPTGDRVCSCTSQTTPVMLPNQPTVVFGGTGVSADPFNGHRMMCIPNGGDIFGCKPCKEVGHSVADARRFLTDVRPFIGPQFFLKFFTSPSAGPSDAGDMETASVAQLAAGYHVPFLAFRALSDGNGDPLHLPGFPFQFFVYYQLAADNAATMAKAFLRLWATHS
ncbi:MAG: 5'-methylthioadenosine/S-adenosylhomocysteine nucleosidase [Actinomycetes bacterium]